MHENVCFDMNHAYRIHFTMKEKMVLFFSVQEPRKKKMYIENNKNLLVAKLLRFLQLQCSVFPWMALPRMLVLLKSSFQFFFRTK